MNRIQKEITETDQYYVHLNRANIRIVRSILNRTLDRSLSKLAELCSIARDVQPFNIMGRIAT